MVHMDEVLRSLKIFLPDDDFQPGVFPRMQERYQGKCDAKLLGVQSPRENRGGCKAKMDEKHWVGLIGVNTLQQ